MLIQQKKAQILFNWVDKIFSRFPEEIIEISIACGAEGPKVGACEDERVRKIKKLVFPRSGLIFFSFFRKEKK